MDNEVLTIRQVSQKLGIPSSTIRYYLRHGLVPAVKRNHARYRIFESWQVDWIRTLAKLRVCGFKIADLKKYTNLCRQGKSTVGERQAMITTRIHQMRKEMELLHDNLGFLEQREELLGEVIQKKLETESDWI